MRRTIFAVILCLVLAAACTPQPMPIPTPGPTAEPGFLSVDPAQDLGPISPYIYGTNYGPMHAVTAARMPDVAAAGFTALRFPGGAWGDGMDLIPFQIDQFIAFCKQAGAMPTISVRLLGGSPEKAAELVRYTNIEKKYGVVYWSIGNEPNLYTQLKQADYDYTIDNLNRDWRPIAKAMKAVDPSIKILGPEISQWNDSLATTPKDSSGRDWMTEFLKANGDLVDVVSMHRYPMYSPVKAVTFQDLRDDTRRWQGEMAYLHTLIKEILGHDLPIALTEINSDPTSAMLQETSPDSFYNAIWYADVLGQLAQSDVFMVNQWVISQRNGGLGLLYGDDIRPTFYVFPLYKHFGSERRFASSGVVDVDVFAAARKDGTLTVMVINLSDVDKTVTLQIKGKQPASAQVWRLDKDHNAADLGMQSLSADGLLSLPAQSATLYVFSK
jgi:hypothetical protein